ncbi:hypothetical protein Rsub_11067 [Raphidocelis subcapitata]|uniref:Uncharacterized protein n=1 Tax=Raphidocelis subcapitata TaxID=307507 RepID=A0A2V0PLM1_9CHLO|nr:hypothetical protein Rsub_11067 [Raphidocelis subcapitata]|eukprot:GBF98247.1 hypothetical protein Rsub_11067 [Raphidocelis subcapitata]
MEDAIPVEEAAEALYWQAVQDSLAGRHAEGQARLRALGCAFALAPALWDAARGAGAGPCAAHAPQSAAGASAGDATGTAAAAAAGASVLALDGALPAALLRRLQAAFGPGARYWGDHGYEAAPFFSYVFPLAQESPAAPAQALEAAARLLHRRAAAVPSAERLLRGCTHVEFWAHSRGLDLPHQLHFDASSLLFLTGCGGPTVVLDQTPAGPRSGQRDGSAPPAGCDAAATTAAAAASAASAAAAERLEHHAELPLDADASQHLAPRAWLLHPAEGRWALWPGDLLHGVLPGQPELPIAASPLLAAPQGSAPPLRTTLVLAWWRGDPRDSLREAAPAPADEDGAPWPRPMMSLPPVAEAASGKGAFVQQRARWAADIALDPGEWEAMQAAQDEADAAAAAGGGGLEPVGSVVSPCWVAVGAEAGGAVGASSSGLDADAAAEEAALAEAPLPPLRFFLRSARDIEEQYPAAV